MGDEGEDGEFVEENRSQVVYILSWSWLSS